MGKATSFINQSTSRYARLALLAVGVLLAASASFAAGVIKVYNPPDGSKYDMGATITISWECEYYEKLVEYTNASINLSYSTDGGKSWMPIVGGLSPKTTSYKWTTDKSLTAGKYIVQVAEPAESKKYTPLHSPGNSGTFSLVNPCVAPIISAHPQSTIACTGSPLTMTVASDAVVGTATYQWYKNDALVSTTPIAVYTIANPTVNDGGTYYVRILLACGESATSKTATVSIGTATEIKTQPTANIAVCENTPVSLSVSAVGDNLTYQWRRNGASLLGSNKPTIIFDPSKPANAGTYDCLVTGTCGAPVVSASSSVNIFAMPAITDKPVATTVCTGQPLVLTVGAVGAGLTYQWYKDGSAITGATASTFTVPSSGLKEEGTYEVVVATGPTAPAACARRISVDPVRVSVYKAPMVVASPENTFGCTGGNTTLTVQADGFGLSYQWFKNGVAIKDAKQYSISLRNLKMSDAGQYHVSVTGTCGMTVTSTPATLTMKAMPSLTASPTDQTVTAGGTVVLDAKISDANTSVQWYRNSVIVPGATTPHYEIQNATVEASGVYYAVFNSTCGGLVTAPATIIVNDPNSLQPRLTVSTNTIDLGEIPTGYSAERTVDAMLTNTGNADLEVQDLLISDPMFVLINAPTLPLTIAPGATATLTFKGMAGIVGPMTANMVVSSNSPTGNATVELAATSVLRYSLPNEITFPATIAGASAEQCFDIKNNSSMPITLDNIMMSGLNTDQFTMVDQTPISIDANGTKNVCVRFVPTDEGTKSALLMISSRDGGNSSASINGEASPATSVEDEMKSAIVVYPNPTTGVCNIRLNGVQSTGIRVISAIGTIVAELSGDATSWNGADSNGNMVASGVYNLVVTSNSGSVSIPVSVNR